MPEPVAGQPPVYYWCMYLHVSVAGQLWISFHWWRILTISEFGHVLEAHYSCGGRCCQLHCTDIPGTEGLQMWPGLDPGTQGQRSDKGEGQHVRSKDKRVNKKGQGSIEKQWFRSKVKQSQ